MRNLTLFMISSVALIAAYCTIKVLMIPAGIFCVIFYVLAIKDNNKAARAGSARIKETDDELRTQLTAVHKLAIVSLSGADEELKAKVVDLLVEAGKHLGYPYTNSRVIYGSDYFINWNTDGLKLVEQAKALIDNFVAGAKSQG